MAIVTYTGSIFSQPTYTEKSKNLQKFSAKKNFHGFLLKYNKSIFFLYAFFVIDIISQMSGVRVIQ